MQKRGSSLPGARLRWQHKLPEFSNKRKRLTSPTGMLILGVHCD